MAAIAPSPQLAAWSSNYFLYDLYYAGLPVGKTSYNSVVFDLVKRTGRGLLLLVTIICAFTMGVTFKGKSGWCSSTCPLLPLQRVYGQTPFANLITLDMGGTSADMSVIQAREPTHTTRTQVGGLPLIVPVVAVDAARSSRPTKPFDTAFARAPAVPASRTA